MVPNRRDVRGFYSSMVPNRQDIQGFYSCMVPSRRDIHNYFFPGSQIQKILNIYNLGPKFPKSQNVVENFKIIKWPYLQFAPVQNSKYQKKERSDAIKRQKQIAKSIQSVLSVIYELSEEICCLGELRNALSSDLLSGRKRVSI